MELRGITEFVGESGSGKSILALSLAKEKNTIYISQAQFKFKFLPPSIIVKQIDTFLNLKIFIYNELRKLARTCKIEQIILDGLEDYLFTITKPLSQYFDIFKIVVVLKNLCFNNKVDVIVINSSYKKLNYLSKVTSWYLGLQWEYLINSRYVIRKRDHNRIAERVLGGEVLRFNFVIDDFGAHFIDQNLPVNSFC